MSEDVKIGVDGEEEFYQKLGQFEGEVDQVAQHIKNKLGPEEISKYKADVDKLEADAEETFNKIKQKIDQVKLNKKQMAQTAMSTAQQAYGLLNQVVSIFGDAIPAVTGAAVQSVFTTANIIFQMAEAQSAGGPMLWAQAAMTLVAGVMTMTTAWQAVVEEQKILRELENVKSITETSTKITVRL